MGAVSSLSYTPRPQPSFVDCLEKVHWHGKSRWRNRRGWIYEYDPNHGGELEVYNKRGVHLGTANIMTGELIKPAERGRKIDV